MTHGARQRTQSSDSDRTPHAQEERSLFSWRSASAAGAVTLAAAAIFNNLRARQAEARNPPIGRFITVDGVQLHYVERGAGSPIILLHGNGAMVDDWEASGVIDGLAAEHRVVAFDRPGFGRTPRPRTRIWTPKAQAALFAKAMRQLDLEHAVIVGHSWGVLPALALALDHPELVSGLVLMSGVFYPEIRADILTSLPSAVPGPGDVMCHTITPLVATATSPMQTKSVFRPAAVSDRFAGFPMDMSLRPGQMRAQVKETVMLPVVTRRLSKRYGELNLPVTIVTGSGDELANPETQSKRLHQVIRNSRLVNLPGIGHMANYSALAAVLQAITDTAEEASATAKNLT